MISLQNVSKVYGEGTNPVHAVQNITLNVNKNDVFGIIGYSGAGKSTLLRLLNGLETPTSGNVTVIGFAMFGASQTAA